MKSIVNQNASNKSKPFPKLMVDRVKNSVWLMSNSSHGTLVSRGRSSFSIGEQPMWLQSDKFVDFDGSVTLSNRLEYRDWETDRKSVV